MLVGARGASECRQEGDASEAQERASRHGSTVAEAGHSGDEGETTVEVEVPITGRATRKRACGIAKLGVKEAADGCSRK
jgi:hypothetical protein